MVFDRKLGDAFKKSSLEYHTSRRGYPDALFSDIINISKINIKSNILDVGCGSGLSTLPLANKGYSIIGIDISEELIKIARGNAKNNNPQYILAPFEDYDFQNSSFDLIISGQAFHWLDEKIAYSKCAKILNSIGYLAIFAKFNDYKKSTFLSDLKKIFTDNCNYYPDGLHQDDYIEDYLKEIKQTNLFTDIQSKKYTYFLEYDLESYRTYILSNSWVMKLNNEQKINIMKKIDSLLLKFKWPMKIPFGAALIMAKIK